MNEKHYLNSNIFSCIFSILVCDAVVLPYGYLRIHAPHTLLSCSFAKDCSILRPFNSEHMSLDCFHVVASMETFLVFP
jgi:hypothetical protein